MSHNNLANYYEMNFNLKQHHSWSIAEIEDLYPYERDIYVEMLIKYMEEKKKEAERQAQNEMARHR